MQLSDLKKKRVLFLGLGVNNRGLARYLDQRQISFDVIEEWGKPDELISKVLDYDLFFRSPGLPYTSEPVQEALKKGIEVYSQTKLFFDLCPARIIGVTGTKGKGTTATLIYNILRAAEKSVYLAGNIGRDPFDFMDELKKEDWVVLELSSFQLQDLHKSPHTAVVLKITSEHLDHHQSTEEYREAKTNILAHQTESDFAVINYDHEVTRSFVDLTSASVLWNSTETTVSPGCFVYDGKVVLDSGDKKQEIMDKQDVGLIGDFNLENITAAIAAASVAGVRDKTAISKAVSEFKGLEHRLEFVREIDGVSFYNDSFSTAPETTIAAMSAFTEPLILIVGGSEKKSDFSGLAQKIASTKVKALIAVGKEGRRIAETSRKSGFQGKIYDTGLDQMAQIVAKANEIADEGDVVLLSPAAASFDMFENYKERGSQFKEEVLNL